MNDAKGRKIRVRFSSQSEHRETACGERVAHRAGFVGREGTTMRDIVLKYPVWQEPYRAAVIEANPKLLKHEIAAAEQAAKLQLKQLLDQPQIIIMK